MDVKISRLWKYEKQDIYMFLKYLSTGYLLITEIATL